MKQEYRHMMEQIKLTDEEKERIIENIENKRTARSRKPGRRLVVLAMVTALVLTVCVCGFAVTSLSDAWLQRPSDDPLEVVRTALENQLKKEYTISMEVKNVRIDEAETIRVSAMYMGSELAQYRGWTDECLSERFVVVKAEYYVEYDHKKTFLDDGYRKQYFYLIQDEESGDWTIIDNTSGAG